MRKIKFRGKDKETGEWVYGNYHHCTIYYGEKVDKHYISSIDSTCECGEQIDYEIIPETLGQYVKDDSYGKELYEGDIVKIYNQLVANSEVVIGPIVYKDGAFIVKGHWMPISSFGYSIIKLVEEEAGDK